MPPTEFATRSDSTDGARPSTLPDARRLLRSLERLRAVIDADAEERLKVWQPNIVRQAFIPSARNLAQYLSLRSRDLRELQAALVPWGLSSLGRSESRVMPNLDAVIATLAAVVGSGSGAHRQHPPLDAHLQGATLLQANTNELFGLRDGERRIRIMVTMSTEAATDPSIAADLIARGMDCARINCAHDDEATWRAIATNVRHAAVERGRDCRVLMDLSGPRLRIDTVKMSEASRRLWPGDRIRFHEATRPPLDPDDDIHFAFGCSIEGIIGTLRPGHRVYVDGGKVEGKVESVEPGEAIVRVTWVGPKGGKLAIEKGLNFPDTALRLGALTEEDRRALNFVATNADIIGYSFVQSARDVATLQEELEMRLGGAPLPALIAKIETRRALSELPEIIARAAGRQAFGVMIARGDLAVELGYERLSEVQEEILWLCEAAHTPVVWATQVLEHLVTKGMPSRAEMTDAAMSERAECVMLNKGPYVANAVDVLDDVLTRMQSHQHKKSPQLRALRIWKESEVSP